MNQYLLSCYLPTIFKFVMFISENANKVWLCCSTHNLGRLFVLDIVNRVMHPVERDVSMSTVELIICVQFI